jgi:hypothetical protein
VFGKLLDCRREVFVNILESWELAPGTGAGNQEPGKVESPENAEARIEHFYIT